MNAHVTIRKFEPADIGTVINLLQDVSDYRPNAEAILSLAEAFATQPDCHACVAVWNNRLVGFGSVFVISRVRGGRSGIVEDMVVAKDMRGKGIGRLILSALLDEARKLGCFKVSLESAAAAQPFYAANGFVASGQIMKILIQD
ncbi:GNAT family N-acetyltransferase [Hydrogenophaga aquatica]